MRARIADLEEAILTLEERDALLRLAMTVHITICKCKGELATLTVLMTAVPVRQ